MKFLIVNDFRGSKYSEKIIKDFESAIKKVGEVYARRFSTKSRSSILKLSSSS